MKTRQNSLHPTYISTRKFEIKASQTEIVGDLQQMIGSIPDISLPKKNKSQPFSPADFPKRQKLKRATKAPSPPPAVPEDAIGILGFASFLVEAEAQSQIPAPVKQPKKTQKPATKQVKKQAVSEKPQVKAQVSYIPRNFGMYMNYVPRIIFPQAFKQVSLASGNLPRAANHLKIAFYINKLAKVEKSRPVPAEC
ncbi:unnamed protein product [Blepharisma stoltei]|uniref:Uncharacterized protein n=1 Tax=Blepharisma stoltei TaxID=1481888 RepID=A0AAU9KAM0_9CILI|nr:unnamed protein product [Blepharisma stoltei]